MHALLALALPLVTVAPADAAELGDDQITRAIELEIMSQRGVDLTDLQVRTRAGVVTLSGELDDLLTQDRAVRIAGTIRGVKAVVDRTTVQVEARDDEELRKDIHTALLIDPAVELTELKLKVRDGKVRLRGQTDSYQERRLAELVVEGIRGVSEVDNDIEVHFAASRPDHEIQAEVEELVDWNVLVDDTFVEVEVEDGVVRFSGTVGSMAEQQILRRQGWVAGVVEVDSSEVEIQYRSDHQREYSTATDPGMERAVTLALAYDPRVASSQVEVDVTGGVATLSGTVPTIEAKRAAIEDARNTNGVWTVDDLLRVRAPQPVSDGALAAQVEAALDRELERAVEQQLFWSPWVDGDDIEVDVDSGAVTLTGAVDSWFGRTKALENAYQAGAAMVKDDLAIRTHTGQSM